MNFQEIFLITLTGIIVIIAIGNLAQTLEKFNLNEEETRILKETKTATILLVLSIITIPSVPIAIYFILNTLH